MEKFKVDIREIIWEIGLQISTIKAYQDRFNENVENDEGRFTIEEVHIENNRYEAEIDMIKKIRREYLVRYGLTEDDIKKYIDEDWKEWESKAFEDINPVNITEEVEVTYTIK